MADVDFVRGEGGENHDFVFPADVDLSGYTTGTFTIKTIDLTTVVKTISVTIPSASLVRWAQTTTDTNVVAGNYVGQLELTGAGLIKKTFAYSVQVHNSFT